MFSKLFSSILSSSIWSEDSDTCKVWVTMVAMQDREGYVFGSPAGIARIAALPVEAVDAAIRKFLLPDPTSTDLVRAPEREGRRIEVIDGGWRLLNGPFYRDLRDSDERRFQNREAQRRARARQHPSASVSPSDSDADAEKNTPLRGESTESTLLALWNEKRGTLPAVKAFTSTRKRHAKARLQEEPDLKRWEAAIIRMAASAFCRGETERGWVATFDFLLRPDTLVKVEEGRYDDRKAKTAAELEWENIGKGRFAKKK